MASLKMTTFMLLLTYVHKIQSLSVSQMFLSFVCLLYDMILLDISVTSRH